jgi:hypothetical protein
MMMVIDDDHDVGLDYEREHDYYYIYIYICTTICMLCIWEFIAVPLSPKWLLGKSARRLRGVGGHLQGGFWATVPDGCERCTVYSRAVGAGSVVHDKL